MEPPEADEDRQVDGEAGRRGKEDSLYDLHWEQLLPPGLYPGAIGYIGGALAKEVKAGGKKRRNGGGV